MPPDQAVNPLTQFSIIPYLLIILIFYFLVIKPQRTQKQQQKQMLADLKKNDVIVTAAGIHGTIVNVKDTTVIIRIDDNARMEIDKEVIAKVTSNTA